MSLTLVIFEGEGSVDHNTYLRSDPSGTEVRSVFTIK